MAGLWSTAPFWGSIVTSSSSAALASALSFEPPPSTAGLPPKAFVTRRAAPAMRAAPTTTAPVAIQKGRLGAGLADGSTEGRTCHHRALCQR